MAGVTAVLPRRLLQRARDRVAAPTADGASVAGASVPTPSAAASAAVLPVAPAAAAGEPVTGPATGTPGWVQPSWAEIVAEHSPRVFRLAYRLTGNRHDAEDLTQDVFVRVFRSLDGFVPGNFEAWLHRITTNLFLDGARRRQRIRFDALADDAGARLADPGAGPVERFDMTHLDGDVRNALMALRPEFRAAVVLCDIEGLPYEEVADVLGVKLGTVRSRIHRGRSQLRERLAHRAPGARPDGVVGGTAGGSAGDAVVPRPVLPVRRAQPSP